MRVNTRAMSPITLGGSTSQVGLRSYQVKRPALAYFVPCRPPLLVFFFFFWSRCGAWWCWDLSWSISLCLGLFLGRVILIVLQEAMETRFSYPYLSLFTISCSSASNFLFPSYILHPSLFLFLLLLLLSWLETRSLFSMVLLVGCMFSKRLVSHLFIVGPSSSTLTPFSSSSWTKGVTFFVGHFSSISLSNIQFIYDSDHE